MNKIKLSAILAAAAIMLTGCGTGTTLATVGNEKITSNDVDFFLTECTVQTGDHAKDVQDAVDTLVENATIRQVAEKLGYSLDDNENQNLKSKVASVRKQYGGTKEYEKMIKDKGIDKNFVENLLTVTTLKQKLSDSLSLEFTDEEKKEYFDNHYYRAKHILIATTDSNTGASLTDEQKAQAKQKAEDILAKAQSGEDFDTLMNANTEDPGTATNPKGYVFTDGDMVPEFEECVKSLEPGQIAMCETDYGYHIIKRYALNEDQELYEKSLFDSDQAITDALMDEALDQQLTTWAEENNITIKKNDSGIEKKKAEPTATPAATEEANEQ